MKQKRKVKSLISKENQRKQSPMTIVLLVLSVILCIGSASLTTFFVGAASQQGTIENFVYTGLAEKAEVLYKMQFVDPGQMDEVKSEIYIDGNSLYVSPNPVVVNGINSNSNEVGTGVYGHVLGGKNNKVYSDNITMIAGENNVVSGDDNATILGGSGNKINVNSNGEPNVIIGGEKNIVQNDSNGNVVIGGKESKVSVGGSDHILLGDKMVVHGGKNAIIGGSGVAIYEDSFGEELSNVFVFSNSKFEPKTSNTFYLNVKNGVGINTGSLDAGMTVKGAVSFGELDINVTINHCSTGNLGVIGSWNGCIVGCTRESMNKAGGWELLDLGEECEKKCEQNNYCKYNLRQNFDNEVEDYTSFCANNVSTGNTTPCFSGINNYKNYKNVIFETMLIDSNTQCPSYQAFPEDKCLFRCNTGFHLTGDIAGGKIEDVRCYSDCSWTWSGSSETIELKHNQPLVAYRAADAYCSNSNGTHRTCQNDKATLICDNGTMYLQKTVNGQVVADKSKPAIVKGYVYKSCTLHQYRCNTSIYNYTYGDIVNPNKFNDNVSSWNTGDRTTTEGIRGKYELCIDYNTEGDGVQYQNGETCIAQNKDTDHYTAHYQWVGCKEGYHTGAGYKNVCMKDCTATTLDGQTITKHHSGTYTFYTGNSATCTGTCQSATFTCNDGIRTNAEGKNKDDYQYADCVLNSWTCPRYNVTSSVYNQWSGTSIYSSCIKYNANGKYSCVTGDTMYNLIGCVTGNHTINNENCVSNYDVRDCSSVASLPNNSHWDGEGKYTAEWSGGWNWGEWGSGNFAEKCTWNCDGGYHTSGTGCKSNVSGKCGTGKYECADGYGASSTGVDGSGGFTWECLGNHGTKASCYYIDGKCGETHYNCLSGTKQERDELGSGYFWDCVGSGGGATAQCFECKAGYHKDGEGTCVAYQCAGELPDNTTLNSSQNPTNDTTQYFCDGSSTAACSYTCPEPMLCNYAGTGCRWPDNGECDYRIPYGCLNGSVERVDTTDSTEWQWYCKGSDDIGSGTYCHVNCADLGQEGSLTWTSLHSGSCVQGTKYGICLDSQISTGIRFNVIKNIDSIGGQTAYKLGRLPFELGINLSFGCNGIPTIVQSDIQGRSTITLQGTSFTTRQLSVIIQSGSRFGALQIPNACNLITSVDSISVSNNFTTDPEENINRVEYIGLCPNNENIEEPHCGNDPYTCTSGEPDHEKDDVIGINTRNCYNSLGEVGCKQNCYVMCPDGYTYSGGVCVLYREYCALNIKEPPQANNDGVDLGGNGGSVEQQDPTNCNTYKRYETCFGESYSGDLESCDKYFSYPKKLYFDKKNGSTAINTNGIYHFDLKERFPDSNDKLMCEGGVSDWTQCNLTQYSTGQGININTEGGYYTTSCSGYSEEVASCGRACNEVREIDTISIHPIHSD